MSHRERLHNAVSLALKLIPQHGVAILLLLFLLLGVVILYVQIVATCLAHLDSHLIQVTPELCLKSSEMHCSQSSDLNSEQLSPYLILVWK